MATHSSILAWKIPWTEEPSEQQSMGSHKVGHDWETKHISTLKYSFYWCTDWPNTLILSLTFLCHCFTLTDTWLWTKSSYRACLQAELELYPVLKSGFLSPISDTSLKDFYDGFVLFCAFCNGLGEILLKTLIICFFWNHEKGNMVTSGLRDWEDTETEETVVLSEGSGIEENSLETVWIKTINLRKKLEWSQKALRDRQNLRLLTPFYQGLNNRVCDYFMSLNTLAGKQSLPGSQMLTRVGMGSLGCPNCKALI